jgi:hypothetical protein
VLAMRELINASADSARILDWLIVRLTANSPLSANSDREGKQSPAQV